MIPNLKFQQQRIEQMIVKTNEHFSLNSLAETKFINN